MKYLKKYENYLTDEEIEKSYSDWRINKNDFKMYSDRSGMVVLEQDYIEGCDDCPTEKVDDFIIYDDGSIAFNHWYPDKLALEIIRFIYEKLPEDNKNKKLVWEYYKDRFVEQDSKKFNL